MTATTFPVGTTLGEFRLLRLAERLGDLELWEAERTDYYGQTTAVSLKLPGRGARADARARQRHEAAHARARVHPHIVGVLGLEEPHGLEALACEPLLGPSLAQVQAEARSRRQRLPARAVADLLVQLSEALAHVARVVDISGEWVNIAHRAVTPQRIRFDDHARVRLLDFSCAWTGMGQVPPVLTADAATARYRAPELDDEPTGGRMADLWALGVIVWELLLTRPFTLADSVAGVREEIARRSAAQEAAAAPAGLTSMVELLERLLQRDPKARRLEPSELIAASKAARDQVPPGVGLTGVVPALGGFRPASSAPPERVKAAPSPAARPLTTDWSAVPMGGGGRSVTEDWSVIPMDPKRSRTEDWSVIPMDGRPKTEDWSVVPMKGAAAPEAEAPAEEEFDWSLDGGSQSTLDLSVVSMKDEE